MADNVQPDAGEQRDESTSGLFISAEPLRGSATYKLGGDDSDSDKGDSDGSDSPGGGDSDASDAADAGSIVPDADSSETDDKMNPLGIGDTNVDGPDADASDAK